MRSRLLPRHRLYVAYLLVPVMLATLLQGVASSQAAPGDCLPAAPVSSVTKGMRATGWTVASGTNPQPFDVEVLGVLKDAILPGRDIIVAEISGRVVDAGGGIWAGMSGSPVYVTQGGQQRLLGAVAYAFTWGESRIAGITPGPDIVALAKGGGTAVQALVEPATVELDPAARAMIAAQAGVPTSEVGSQMRRLQVPLSVSGLQQHRLAKLREKARTGALPFIPYAGGSVSASATASSSAIQPGGNFAATLSYGDITFAGVGTATYVCDGRVVAFGHPMLFSGPVTMGANLADAITIVKDPVWGSYKLATIGRRVGTVEVDRMAGIAGPLGGSVATVPVTSRIRSLDTGVVRSGRTEVVFADWLSDIAVTHAFANIDTVFDQVSRGNANTTVRINGRREDGRTWTVTRSNRFVSDWDIAFEAVFEAYFDLLSLANNPFEEIEVTSVDFQIDVDGRDVQRYTIKEVLVSSDGVDYVEVDEAGGLIVQAGKLAFMRVTLSAFRAEDVTVDFAIGVPHDASGFGYVEVMGGPVFRDPWECMFNPEACVEGDDGLDGVLKEIATRARSDELFAQLTLFPDPFGGEPPFDPDFPEFDEVIGSFKNGGEFEPRVVSTSKKRLDRVVTGGWSFPVMVEPGVLPDTSVACPPGAFGSSPFADVWGRTHESTISCLYGLGIVRGVTDSTFAPQAPVSRAQMATLIANTLDAAGVQLPPGGHAFTDVAGHPHASAIGRLAAAGIVSGKTATTFAPNESMTRAQMASALVGAYEYAIGGRAPVTSGWFMDIGGTTHERAVNAAAEARFVTGVTPGVYGPGQPMRRGQMTTALARLLNTLMIEGGGGFPPDDFFDE